MPFIPDKEWNEMIKSFQRVAKAGGTGLHLCGQEIGKAWERECYERFCDVYGQGNVIDYASKQHKHDLIVCGKKVQCKTRQLNHTVVHLSPDGKTVYEQSDIDVFALRLNGIAYILPFSAASFSETSGHLTFNARTGKRWREAWDMIGQDISPTEFRPTLLFPEGL